MKLVAGSRVGGDRKGAQHLSRVAAVVRADLREEHCTRHHGASGRLLGGHTALRGLHGRGRKVVNSGLAASTKISGLDQSDQLILGQPRPDRALEGLHG
jgi:hypothetical protein